MQRVALDLFAIEKDEEEEGGGTKAEATLYFNLERITPLKTIIHRQDALLAHFATGKVPLYDMMRVCKEHTKVNLPSLSFRTSCCEVQLPRAAQIILATLDNDFFYTWQER